MKTITQTMNHSLIGTISAGAILLLASRASAQNLFVSDYGTGDIYEYTSGGVQSTYSTGLNLPAGLAFDNSTGDLYVAGYGSGVLYKIAPGGGAPTIVPTTGLNSPEGLAFDSAGNLYIANLGGNDIIKITPGGVQSTYATGLDEPMGLAFNSAGDLFVGNLGNNTITEITPGPSPVESLFASGLASPWGMAFNNAGNLFVGNYANYASGGDYIAKITPGDMQTTFVPGSEFSMYPTEMAFNNAGDLVVGEGRTPDVLVFSPSGSLLQTIDLSGAEDINGLAFQGVTLPVPEPKSILVLAAGGATLIAAASLRKHKTLSTKIQSK